MSILLTQNAIKHNIIEIMYIIKTNILLVEKALKNVNNPSPIKKLLINEPMINTIDIGTICFCFPLNIKKEQNTINTDIAHGLNPSINPAIIIPVIEIFQN